MTKLTLALWVASILLGGCTSPARSSGLNGVKGLSPEICAQLNGIWENVVEGEMQAKIEQWKSTGTFSWGKGKYTPNSSIIIDLAASPPTALIPGLAYVKVLEVKVVGANRYELKTENIPKEATPKVPTLSIMVEASEVLVFSKKIGNVPADPKTWRFNRYYGPENPLP